MTLHRYFQTLADFGRDLLDHMPIPAAIQPIAQTFATLKPALDAARPAALAQLEAVARPAPAQSSSDDAPIGMNSIGILADRLTILICKEWYLRHRQQRPAQADTVRDAQIADIVTCLALARPGHAGLLAKVSPLTVDTASGSFAAAYYGLLAANLMMWETQEMLYTRDMDAVQAEELRDYIRFFSQENMRRNHCIAECERLYWARA